MNAARFSALLLSAALCLPAAAADRVTITVLQTSDLHANLLPWNYARAAAADWGLARVATRVRRIRASEPNVLLLDGGDTIQGAPAAWLEARRPAGGPHFMAAAMNALGYDVWRIRFLAFLFSGLWSGVAGLLFLYYNQFVSPQTVALTASAEVLLMVISGGTATLLGPIAGALLVVTMKNVASSYIERWNFVLGAIFVAIVIFMPEGLVPGSLRLWRWGMRRWRLRLAGPAAMAAVPPGNGGGVQ